MRKGWLALVCVLIIALFNGCGEKQDSVSDRNKQGERHPSIAEDSNEPAIIHENKTELMGSGKVLPVIDHLDTYPFPVPAGWKEEKFEVREYDEGMDWEAVFTFDENVTEQALAYKEVIEELG